ncbi:MAG: proline--tRNA ligase [Ignavibacteriales bacterium]
MKVSELLIPTLREDPSDAEIVSHRLLLRAGMIRKTAGGIYTYLPLGYRVIKKIMNIVREEMDRAGGQEVGLPIVQPREIWDQSGRWQVYGDEMWRVKDRHGRDFCLGPTHEEVITTLVAGEVHSYRQLPLLLYQIQDKFRDEIRPRFGLMRSREFIMKDLYSFDVDEDGLDISYRKMYHAYSRIYDRLGLEYRVVEADSGAIGGNSSHEFTVLAGSGESLIVYCDTCDYAANIEKAECRQMDTKPAKSEFAMECKSTPGIKSVDDVAAFLKIDASKVIKTLIYIADEKAYAVLVRGDREVNEIKLKNYLQANDVIMARDDTVKDLVGVEKGSIGPMGLTIPILADQEVEIMVDAVCGANQEGYHMLNVLPGRDFKPQQYLDLRNAKVGDSCPRCDGRLLETRGIEVGQVFKLGTKYSSRLDANFVDEEGKEHPFVMGCYGIGVSRTMAAAVEQNYDENGVIWPIPIAPFHVIIVPVNIRDDEQMKHAFGLYEALQEIGIEVMIDDRDERAGVKFKDADLIGIPIRITVGKALKDGKYELKKRSEKESELIESEQIVDAVLNILKIKTYK